MCHIRLMSKKKKSILIYSDRIDSNSVFTPPDHVELPELSDENELLYEMQTIVIFVIAMSTQYLNLFRTFWWMPDTYRRYAMVCNMNLTLTSLNSLIIRI